MPPFQYEPYANPYAASIGDLLERRHAIEAQRAMSIANAQAQAQMARGQVWGNAIQNIGQTVAAIPGQIQAQRDAAQDREMRRLTVEDAKAQFAARRKASEDASILASAQSIDLDPDAIEGQLKQLGRGDLAGAFRQSWTAAENARATLQANRSKAEEAEADYFGALAAGVKAFDYDLGAVRTAFAKAKADGYEDADGILSQLEKNPASVKQLVDSLIQRSPAQRKLIGEEETRALAQTREEREAATARQAAADREADNARQAAQAEETARHNREMERSNRLQEGRSAAQAEETARHNRAMEENARNTKIGRPVISGDANKIADFDTSLDDVAVLRDAVSGNKATGTAAYIGTKVPNWLTEFTGWGADAKSKNAVIARVKQVIGKTLEGGVLRKEDEEKYKDILPTIGDVDSVVVTKLDGLEKAVQQRRQRTLDSLEDAGYNVSRYNERATRGPSGVTVNMKAPDGRPLQVPAEHVEEAKRRGATVVGQ